MSGTATVMEAAARHFWEGVAEQRLLLERCDNCGIIIWYPRGFCPACGSPATTWEAASGRGEVYTFTVVRRSWGQWAQRTPYVLAYVTLEEGPCVMTNVVGCDVDDVFIGQGVEVCFEPDEQGEALFAFSPAKES